MDTHALESITSDILEEIFLTCVYWYRTRISPLTLAAVCRRWRDITLQNGRLWTDIDALKLKAAELFVQRSQRADLDVVWCEDKLRQDGVGFVPHSIVNDMPWLNSQHERFRVLAVHTTSKRPGNILPILSLRTTTLPRLKALVLASTDQYGDIFDIRPGLLKLETQMPCLCHVTLW